MIAPPHRQPGTSLIQPGNFRLSAAGAKFIKSHEGYRETAYDDAGHQSIGYGHQIKPGEDHLRNGITQAQAEELFRHDTGWAVEAVNRNVRVPLTQNQVDALVDIAYNTGPTNFANSPVVRALNAGNTAEAAQQFGYHTVSQGRVNDTLVTRRAQGAAVFLGSGHASGDTADITLRSGERGVLGRAGGAVGDTLRGWFYEGGEFSGKKTALAIGGLLALVMAINYAPMIALAAFAIFAIGAVVMMSKGSGMMEIAAGGGRSRGPATPGQQQDLQLPSVAQQQAQGVAPVNAASMEELKLPDMNDPAMREAILGSQAAGIETGAQGTQLASLPQQGGRTAGNSPEI